MAAKKCAILFVGFNNWGKTTVIRDVFGGRKRFYKGKAYEPKGCGMGGSYVVMSFSNDDFGEIGYMDAIATAWGSRPPHVNCLVSALCPTKEPNNSACRILNSDFFNKFDEIHAILLRYKWDFHAKLIVPAVEIFLKKCNPKVIVHVLDECGNPDEPCCRAKPCGEDEDRRKERRLRACDILKKIASSCGC